MENENKKLMENAKENRDRLIERLTIKMEELEKIINDINSEENQTISKYLKEAKDHDVNYIPDRSIVRDFEQIKLALNTVKEKLQSLSLTEDTIFDEDKYLIAAEEVLEKIDAVIEGKKNAFKQTNNDQFDQNFDRKIETDIELSNSRIELGEINAEIEDLEAQNNELKSGLIYKLNISLFNKKKNAKIGENDDKLSELYKKKRELKTKISRLELEEKAQHFVPNQTDQKEEEKENKREDKESEEVK